MGLMRTRVAHVGGAVAGGDPAARRPLARREGLVLTIVDDLGVHGTGEASPLPGYSPDTVADVEAELARWRPPPLDPAGRPAALLQRAGAGVHAPSARFAVEAAVLDWLGRRVGLPAHRVLGASDGPRTIPLRHLVPLVDAAGAAAALGARGVRHLKLKVGARVDEELRALRAVRGAAPDAEILLDANGTLPADAVVELCAAYRAAGVRVVEEPCAVEVLIGLPRLAVAVALDESLVRADAAALMAVVARAQALAAVVLKPTILGGVGRCLALAGSARALGAEPIVTHTFDGPVAMAAAAELALALPEARVAGLAPHGCLGAYPLLRGAALGDVALASHDAPGLGLEDAP